MERNPPSPVPDSERKGGKARSLARPWVWGDGKKGALAVRAATGAKEGVFERQKNSVGFLVFALNPN